MDIEKYKDVVVTIQDMRNIPFGNKIGYCSRGARIFAQQNNLDMKSFLEKGIPAEKLLSLNDEMANAAVKEAAKRMGIE